MVKKRGKLNEKEEEPKESEISVETRGESVGSESNSSHVIIRVQKQGLKDVNMRIRKDVKMGKIMAAYCKHMGLEFDALRFTLDGKRIQEKQTPHDVGLRDGDVIDVWSDQSGGGGSAAAVAPLFF